jgi:hypothetical protein
MTTAVDMTERELTAQVVELATLLGWSRYHTWRSKHSAAGFPDETLWRDRVVFLELKTAKGKLSLDQRRVIAGLVKASAECYVIRPADIDLLAHVLTARTDHGWHLHQTAYLRSRAALNAALSAELG